MESSQMQRGDQKNDYEMCSDDEPESKRFKKVLDDVSHTNSDNGPVPPLKDTSPIDDTISVENAISIDDSSRESDVIAVDNTRTIDVITVRDDPITIDDSSSVFNNSSVEITNVYELNNSIGDDLSGSISVVFIGVVKKADPLAVTKTREKKKLDPAVIEVLSSTYSDIEWIEEPAVENQLQSVAAAATIKVNEWLARIEEQMITPECQSSYNIEETNDNTDAAETELSDSMMDWILISRERCEEKTKTQQSTAIQDYELTPDNENGENYSGQNVIESNENADGATMSTKNSPDDIPP